MGSSLVISLRGRKCSQEQTRFGALPGVLCSGKFKDLFESGASLGGVFAHVPEAKQGSGEPKAPVEVASLKEKIKGGAKVIVLDIAARQPGIALGFI
jgi:hypothetical protein